jgi:hypothetical protein
MWTSRWTSPLPLRYRLVVSAISILVGLVTAAVASRLGG